MTERPKVSVLMITYNHEAFIAQAVESVLMQETDFKVELVIGEDCSTDRTRDTVQEYGNRHPDRIRILIREQNIGARRNLLETFQACRGEYIALLEGDDFWTDMHKLQTQVDIMDADPEVVICGHNVAMKREDGSVGLDVYVPKGFNKSRLYFEDMFAARIHTCSLMYRSKALRKAPADRPWGHTELLLYVAEHGVVEYREDVMATYRLNDKSVWNPLNPLFKSKGEIDFWEEMDAYYGYRYHSQIVQVIERLWGDIAGYYANQAAVSNSWTEPLDSFIREMNERANKVDDVTQRRVVGHFWFNLGISTYISNPERQATAFMLRAFRCNPAYLRNRGAWAVAIKSMLPVRVIRATKIGVQKSS